MGPVGEENVEQAVVVVVEECDSAQRRINDRFVADGPVVEDKVDARVGLAVFKLNRARGRRGGCRGRRVAFLREHVYSTNDAYDGNSKQGSHQLAARGRGGANRRFFLRARLGWRALSLRS